MAAAASLMGLVNQLQGMESQFSMVLMEAAMKIASFTDASIFLLIDTPEGRSWVGRKNLKEEFINGRMQIRPNDVEFDVNPNVSALVRQPTIAEKMAEQQMQMQQQMQMNQMRQTTMRGGAAGRGRGFSGQSSPSGMSPGGESRKRSLPGAGGGTPNKQGRPDDSEVVAVNIKEEDLESDQDLKNVIGRVGVGDTGGSNGDGAEEGGEDEIVEEKPNPGGGGGGGGDDSSSSFLDFPGGGGYDPNQPGSSRDLVPAGNQGVAAGAAGQKDSGQIWQLLENLKDEKFRMASRFAPNTVLNNDTHYKIMNSVLCSVSRVLAENCPIEGEHCGPHVGAYFNEFFGGWYHSNFPALAADSTLTSKLRSNCRKWFGTIRKRFLKKESLSKSVVQIAPYDVIPWGVDAHAGPESPHGRRLYNSPPCVVKSAYSLHHDQATMEVVPFDSANHPPH